MPPKKGKDKAGGGQSGLAAAKAAAAAVAAAKLNAAAAGAGSGSGKKKSGGLASAKPPDSDFIVFTNSTDSGSGGRRGGGGGGAGAGAGTGTGGGAGGPGAAPTDGPPKPTVKQLIGGASWTGKLPVNLLSEHCQKQKWEKPEYEVRKVKDGFSALVSLSARNVKTGETTKLDSFKLPPSHVHLAVRPTALEARHTAATYGLFRVCSMKNLHMMLPPDYKSLWRELGTLKAQDVREGKGWMYEADPFTAQRERELARATAEKKRAEARTAAEARDKAGGGGPGVAIRSGSGSGNNNSSSNTSNSNTSRGWANVPKIEMGARTRAMLEDLLRRGSEWNPAGVAMGAAERARAVNELSQLGFRGSHVEEAVALCQDREEALEWLLVHVPEDDLPRWALPESYSAGVSVGATDLRREGAIQRLAQSGYAADLCRRVYDAQGGEAAAAAALQEILMSGGSPPSASQQQQQPPQQPQASLAASSYDSPESCWDTELASLESVFDSQFRRLGPDVCEIRLADLATSASTTAGLALQFRRSPRYPAHLLVAIVAPQLPAYIRLSILRQALAYMDASLRGEELKIFYVVDWVQQHVDGILERPGALRDISAAAASAAEVTPGPDSASASAPGGPAGNRVNKRRPPRHPRPLKWTVDDQSRQDWQRRQATPAMQTMLAARRRLPAWDVREAVVDQVRDHQVTIISGETGSGKSTQAVQFVLDDLYGRGLGGVARIIVTQPRRISALGLADRVSEERCTPLGGEVGYAIRGENRHSRETRIVFVTTGVLLRRLQVSGGRESDVVAALADVSHIVIDEVHERSLDTDFLLCILRDVLPARPDLKLVLMSATLDASAFRDYFAANGLTVGAVEIAGRTFPVEDFYLDDVVRATGFGLDGHDNTVGSAKGAAESPDPVAKAIQRLGGRIHYGLVADTVHAIADELTGTAQPGGILVFMPGVAEINQVCSLLRTQDASRNELHVLPLHAALETREQRRVFAPPPSGRRKVVVATNVAETSITIDDIVAVVDSGRVKETTFDPASNMRRLEETWVSRAAAKQRRGRAGRVRAGQCYKLYTRHLEEATMAERPEPEMRRVPLEQLCLAVRAMGIADVAAFLGRAPSPPAVAAVAGALDLLCRMGVMTAPDADGRPGRLTALGRQLAAIPADLRCGKLVVFGALFGCLHEAVTIAAVLSTRSPFVAPAERRDDARAARMRFASGPIVPGGAVGDAAIEGGDLLTDLRAVLQWDAVVDGAGGPGGRNGNGNVYARPVRAFCDENFLSLQTLIDIASTRTQLYTSLAELGIRRSSTSSPVSPSLLRALTAAAFAPQIARIQLPDQKFAASVSGTVALDPEARTIRYFAQDHGRVFVHPSSTLFHSQGFGGRAAFLSYFSLIATSKVFVRDLTPFNAYTLLLFAGQIDLDTLGRGLVVDGWLRLRGWARIGVLVSRLRRMVDSLIARRLGTHDDDDDGNNNTNNNTDNDTARDDLLNRDIIKAVVKLIELDGMDA